MAYKLTEKVLRPSTMERMNASLSDAFFHESTISALRYYSENGYPQFKETIPFMEVVRKWWNIINVKAPSTGLRKRDYTRQPIIGLDDEKMSFLLTFSNWLEVWEKSKMNGLSKETFLATRHSSKALALLAHHVIAKYKFSYVLLGQVQSDRLERRFGRYRQLCGANYFLGVRQILEAEKSIRVKSLILFSRMSIIEVKDCLSTDSKQEDQNGAERLLDALPIEDFTWVLPENKADQNMLFYVAGFHARSIRKVSKCQKCTSLVMESPEQPTLTFEEQALTNEEENRKKEFLMQVNRGGLVTPTEVAYMSCMYIYSFFDSIMKNDSTKNIVTKAENPRNLFLIALEEVMRMSMETDSFLGIYCEEGHEFLPLFLKISSSLFNLMMKNFVNDLNSSIKKKTVKRSKNSKCPVSRKISKLQSKK